MANSQEDNQVDIESRWPTMGDRLFVETHFLSGAAVAEDAAERQWRMVNGYRAGADFLVDQAASKLHHRRDLLYPIVFLFRQSLELHLKQFICEHGPAVSEDANFTDHDLGILWKAFRRIYDHFYPHGGDDEALRVAEAVASEFALADKGSFSFRYPFNKKGAAIFLSISSIELAELRKTMAGIHTFLECVSTDISERFTYEAE